MLHLLHPGRCAISYHIYGFSCIRVVNQVHRTEKIQSQINKEGTRDNLDIALPYILLTLNKILLTGHQLLLRCQKE